MILDKQIAERERQKQDLIEHIDLLNIAYEDAVAKSSIEAGQLMERNQKIKDSTDGLLKKESIIKGSIKSLNNKLDDIKQEIKDQTEYLKEQEENVVATVNDWNNQLKEFADEDKLIRDQKDKLSKDIFDLTQHQTLIERDIQSLVFESERLRLENENKQVEYERELRSLESKIQDAKQKLQEYHLEYEAALQSLESREKSVVIKETALQSREFELVSREKNINMKINMSGL